MSGVTGAKDVEGGNSPVEEDSAGEMTWPGPDFDKQRSLAALKHPLFLRKKRVHSASFSHSGVSGVTIDGVPSDIRALTAALHRSNDPVTFETLSPPLSDEEFERIFSSLMNEFFVHGKTQEVVDSLADLNLAPHQRRRLPYLAITMALQHKQTQYELTSELLSDLCGKVINQAHVQQGFSLVLSELGEIIIDFPKASEHVGRFIARAMVDDILPPKFIEFQKAVFSQPPSVHCHGDSKNGASPPVSAPPVNVLESVGFEQGLSNPDAPSRPGTRNLSDSSNGLHHTNMDQTVGTSVSSGIGSASSLSASMVTRPEVALEALVRAEDLLNLSHAFARLDNIWGVPFGPKATKALIKKIQGLLKAFMESDDLEEATDALLELDSPHFHHELVFQAVIMAIERSTDVARARVVRLLKELCRSVVITPNQLALGVRRVYAELPDLQLDVPAAYMLMERFVTAAHAAGFLPKKLVSEMPINVYYRSRSLEDTCTKTMRDCFIGVGIHNSRSIRCQNSFNAYLLVFGLLFNAK
ncbi:programmed cell death protein 4 [Clonorchis sinensis]|uniref:Programmed cell death protein 4 n=1 Tax=Clonorchis sinensis TaxID=79923 RepID=G7YUS5_CLOSI|nr:programmed cell death protein 4 [Clonorchis sinensis]